jgi:hypothetical protein
MNDIKNLFIASVSAAPSVAAAAAGEYIVSIVSAVVLPVVFFAIGKSVDVALQIVLHRRRAGKRYDDNSKNIGGGCVCAGADGARALVVVGSDAAPAGETTIDGGRAVDGGLPESRAASIASGPKRSPRVRARRSTSRAASRGEETGR